MNEFCRTETTVDPYSFQQPVDGHSFKSSRLGQRRELIQQSLTSLLILPAMVAYYILGGPQDWIGIAAALCGGVLGLLLGYCFTSTSFLWASIKLNGSQVRLQKRDDIHCCDLTSLKRIRVRRSRSRRHRILTVWGANNIAYSVFDPERGDAFEWWAITEARPNGVPVEIETSWFMDHPILFSVATYAVTIPLAFVAVPWLVRGLF